MRTRRKRWANKIYKKFSLSSKKVTSKNFRKNNVLIQRDLENNWRDFGGRQLARLGEGGSDQVWTGLQRSTWVQFWDIFTFLQLGHILPIGAKGLNHACLNFFFLEIVYYQRFWTGSYTSNQYDAFKYSYNNFTFL